MQKSLALDETDHEAWFMAACLADDLGRLDEAADMMQRARELSAETTRYTLYLGTFRLKQGRIEEGRQLLKEALAQNSELVAAHGALAMSLADQQPAAAMDHLATALDLMGPDHHKYHDYLLLKAALHNRLNQPRVARRLLHRILPHRRDEAVTRELARSYRLSAEPLKAAFTWADLSDAEPEQAAYALEATRAFLEAAEAGQADWPTTRRLLRRAENLRPADRSIEQFKQQMARLNPG